MKNYDNGSEKTSPPKNNSASSVEHVRLGEFGIPDCNCYLCIWYLLGLLQIPFREQVYGAVLWHLVV
ncbi:MAG: hypothetical protein ACO3MJ_07950 [Alphaproteobacteria bacterium]